jgi:hypothetical protein
MADDLRSAVAACTACADACERTAAASLREATVVNAMARRVEMDNVVAWSTQAARIAGVVKDCAQLCRLAAAFVARDSGMSRRVAALCATVCERCIEECARHDVEHFRQCALACRRAADACRAFAGATVGKRSEREALPA